MEKTKAKIRKTFLKTGNFRKFEYLLEKGLSNALVRTILHSSLHLLPVAARHRRKCLTIKQAGICLQVSSQPRRKCFSGEHKSAIRGSRDAHYTLTLLLLETSPVDSESETGRNKGAAYNIAKSKHREVAGVLDAREHQLSGQRQFGRFANYANQTQLPSHVPNLNNGQTAQSYRLR